VADVERKHRAVHKSGHMMMQIEDWISEKEMERRED
jgi:hypothetical protein